jgi:hypothetical protein
VAFFRFNRDKRGYEHFYLVEPTTNRRGKVKQRLLYWFRTPPGVRVGREPFDEGIRRALEAQNPGVTFDWRSIVEAPIPSADADKWRERRRAERAAKHAAASADVDDDVADESAVSEQPDAPRDSIAYDAPQEPDTMDRLPVESPQTAAPNAVDPARKRRRRRRGRRSGAPLAPGGSPNEPADVDAKGTADDMALNGTRDERGEEDGSIVDDNAEPGDD